VELTRDKTDESILTRFNDAIQQCNIANHTCLGFVNIGPRHANVYTLIRTPPTLRKGVNTLYIKPSMTGEICEYMDCWGEGAIYVFFAPSCVLADDFYVCLQHFVTTNKYNSINSSLTKVCSTSAAFLWFTPQRVSSQLDVAASQRILSTEKVIKETLCDQGTRGYTSQQNWLEFLLTADESVFSQD